jgi:hypothetical protein
MRKSFSRNVGKRKGEQKFFLYVWGGRCSQCSGISWLAGWPVLLLDYKLTLPEL